MTIRFRARARKRFGPIVLNLSRSGITPSVKVGRVTWSLKRRHVSVDTPGIGSVMATYGGRPQPTGRRAAPALVDEATAIKRTCPRCGSEPDDTCRNPSKRPTKMHVARRRATAPPPLAPAPAGPASALGALVRRLLMLGLVVSVAAVAASSGVALVPWR